MNNPGSQLDRYHSTGCLIEISPSELADRISILELKLAHAKDPDQRSGLEDELSRLRDLAGHWRRSASPDTLSLIDELAAVNAALWRIEDAVREHERKRDFGPEFIELARSVYITNDRRSALRKEINEALGWKPYDGKIHPDYSAAAE